MKRIKIYQVDAFAEKAFQGNPAGVCIIRKPLDEKWMQAIALEMNLSETAFAIPLEGTNVKSCSKFQLRWFTPVLEVDLCGHATLAMAKVLFDVCKVETEKIKFYTKSGELIVSRINGGFCLDFPIDFFDQVPVRSELLEVLGSGTIEDCVLSRKLKMLLIRLKSKEEVIALKPDFTRLGNIEKLYSNRDFIVTARSTDEFDFVSRFFAPGFGINEDPVTGSAHTVLAPYWSEILHKKAMKACQVSLRKGILGLEIHGERVFITGNAIVILEGELQWDDLEPHVLKD